MKELYFYQDRGQTIGPITFEDVKERIKDGRLRLFDLVYRDGEENWRMALEHSALRSEFKSSTLSSLKERPWVCLQRKAESELDFTTTGPFTKDEVAERLQSGEISYSDYAWKDGFQDWKRLGSLEEFNPRMRPTLPAPPVDEPADKLLANVVELKRPKVKTPTPPPEAKTGDLTKPAETPPPLKKKNSKAKAAPPTPTPTPSPTATAPETVTGVTGESLPTPDRRKRKRSRLAFDWGLVGVLLLVLAGSVLIISRFARPHHAASTAFMPSLETAPPEVAPPAVATVPSALPTPPSAPALEKESPLPNAEDTEERASAAPAPIPHELVLQVHPVAGNQAKIEIRTDAAPAVPVYIQIIGLPGQVTEGGAFYRFLRFTPSGNIQQPLDLSSVKLPAGHFVIHADAGPLKREAHFTLGVGDAGYKAAVNHQRKQWAHAIWKERLQLLKLSELLEKQIAQGMVPTKKFSSRGLESLIAVKRAAGGKYFLFEDWWELHQITLEAKTALSPALLTRAQKERDRLSAFSVWK